MYSLQYIIITLLYIITIILKYYNICMRCHCLHPDTHTRDPLDLGETWVCWWFNEYYYCRISIIDINITLQSALLSSTLNHLLTYIWQLKSIKF